MKVKPLIQIIKFPTQVLDCDSHSSTFLDAFFYWDPSICFVAAFSLLENSDHFIALVSLEFSSKSKLDAPFCFRAFNFFNADWDDFDVL